MQRTTRAAGPLHWDDVRLFLALCRARTVGGAAQALGVDTSTVSRRLAALEQALAAALFDRGRDGIVATPAAEALMPVAEQMEDAMARFARAADGLEREVSGLVRLTCPVDLAEVIVLPLLPALLARHPGLRLTIDAAESVLDLTRREADLALRVVRPTRGDLVVTRLRTVQWTLAATPALARELGPLRAWSDAPWVGWGPGMASVGPARWLAQHAAELEPALRSDSLAVQLAGVRAGIGVALVPAPRLAHYGLAPVKLAAPLRAAASTWPADELYLISHRALREVPRVRAVWERLVARLAEPRRGA